MICGSRLLMMPPGGGNIIVQAAHTAKAGRFCCTVTIRPLTTRRRVLTGGTLPLGVLPQPSGALSVSCRGSCMSGPDHDQQVHAVSL